MHAAVRRGDGWSAAAPRAARQERNFLWPLGENIVSDKNEETTCAAARLPYLSALMALSVCVVCREVEGDRARAGAALHARQNTHFDKMDEQLAMFSDLTGCPPEQAQFFLQSAGGNLELAVNEFFLSQEEGAPMDEGSDGEDEGEDGYDDDDDADMDMPPLIPVSPSMPAGVPPPSKRPKVEMRQVRASLLPPLQHHAAPRPHRGVWQAPSFLGSSAEVLALLQQVFGLAAKPKDAAAPALWRAPPALGSATALQTWILGLALLLALGTTPHSGGATVPRRAH